MSFPSLSSPSLSSPPSPPSPLSSLISSLSHRLSLLGFPSAVISSLPTTLQEDFENSSLSDLFLSLLDEIHITQCDFQSVNEREIQRKKGFEIFDEEENHQQTNEFPFNVRLLPFSPPSPFTSQSFESCLRDFFFFSLGLWNFPPVGTLKETAGKCEILKILIGEVESLRTLRADFETNEGRAQKEMSDESMGISMKNSEGEGGDFPTEEINEKIRSLKKTLGDTSGNSSNPSLPMPMSLHLSHLISLFSSQQSAGILPPPSVLSGIFIFSKGPQITPTDWKIFSDAFNAVVSDYSTRESLILHRLGVTVQSFIWGQKGHSAEISIFSKVKGALSEITQRGVANLCKMNILAAQWDSFSHWMSSESMKIKRRKVRRVGGPSSSSPSLPVGPPLLSAEISDRGGRVTDSRQKLQNTQNTSTMPSFKQRDPKAQSHGNAAPQSPSSSPPAHRHRPPRKDDGQRGDFNVTEDFNRQRGGGRGRGEGPNRRGGKRGGRGRGPRGGMGDGQGDADDNDNDD